MSIYLALDMAFSNYMQFMNRKLKINWFIFFFKSKIKISDVKNFGLFVLGF